MANIPAIKTRIDQVVTDKTAADSITPVTLGTLLKDMANNLEPYKVYVGKITTSQTDDPHVIILRNTLGLTISWSRTAEGLYRGDLSLPVTVDKTVVFIDNAKVTMEGPQAYQVVLDTNNSDNVLSNTGIRIEVYP